MIVKLEKDTKYCIKKQAPNTEPSKTSRATINNIYISIVVTLDET